MNRLSAELQLVLDAARQHADDDQRWRGVAAPAYFASNLARGENRRKLRDAIAAVATLVPSDAAKAVSDVEAERDTALKVGDEYYAASQEQAAELRKLRLAYDRSRWQPIETAPRRNKLVLLLYGEENGRRIWGRGYYFKGVPGDGEGWVTSIFYTEPEDDARGNFTPTHWMFMPEEPVSTSAR